MSNRFNQKTLILPAFAALSIIGCAGSNLHTQSKKELTSQQYLPVQNVSFTSKQELAQAPTSYQVIDELKKDKFTVQGSQIFSNGNLPTAKVTFKASDLLTTLIFF